MLDEWKNCFDSDKSVIAVFLDLQRAFETIDRGKLLIKLEKMGVSGGVLKWFLSYLTNRKQNVKLNGKISETMSNELGIPQGSVLGLFCLCCILTT